MNTDIIENAAAPSMELATPKPAAVAVIPTPSGPMGMAMQALSMGMTIADLQGLLALQKDYEANEARKAYVADMAAFKLNPPEIFKTKLVGYNVKDPKPGEPSTVGYFHATLGDVCEKIVEGLAQHGFSHRWDTQQPAGGQIFVTCTLTHRLGHSESTTLNSSADTSGKKNNIQAMASTVSYLQRYTLLGASGLATKDMPDDDGQAGGSMGAEGGAAAAGTSDQNIMDGWVKYVHGAATHDELSRIRGEACTAFGEVKDLAGWEQLKEVIKAHRATLPAPVVKS